MKSTDCEKGTEKGTRWLNKARGLSFFVFAGTKNKVKRKKDSSAELILIDVKICVSRY
jgi:hypothetical protein